MDVVLRAQWRRWTSRQQIVTQSVGAVGVYVASVRPGNADEGQWNPRGLCGSRQDNDGFRAAALALGPRRCQSLLTGWITWRKVCRSPEKCD